MNRKEQEKKICNFETSYKPAQVFYWYSTEIFLYSVLNEALRNQDIDVLFNSPISRATS